MAPKSRLEIDFLRLLAIVESDFAAGNQQLCSSGGWRLEKYIEALEDQLAELNKITVCQPSRDDLILYKKKVKFLKGIVEAEKLKTPSEKLMATQILAPASSAVQTDSNKTREIYHQVQSKHTHDIREELFNTPGLRKRNAAAAAAAGSMADDVDAVLKYHHDIQEKVALEMVALAQNLKENCSIASEIIKKDVDVLEGSGRQAAGNADSLRQNSDKLSDFVRRSCQYWLWAMLGLVVISFLWLVVFMRMFPKRVVIVATEQQQQHHP